MRTISTREYSRDQRLDSRPPLAPQDLKWDSSNLELTWRAPASGPDFTHFNLRIDDDAGGSHYQFPAGTNRLQILRPATVTISCWNDVSQVEGHPARIRVGNSTIWEDATAVYSGMSVLSRVEYDLSVIGGALTVISPVTAADNQRLLLYFFQDPVIVYPIIFDPGSFVDSADLNLDPAFAAVREYSGRTADGKWWPIGPFYMFDPTI